MKRIFRLGFGLIGGLILSAGITYAATGQLGIKPGNYRMSPVSNHTPWGVKTAEKYWASLQKIYLDTGNVNQFKNLPELGMKKPYTGFIVLGDPARKFGFIVDILGEEKRLFVDTDGDGSFAGEPYTLLLNEWYGSFSYWVMGPEPIELKIGYGAKEAANQRLEIGAMGVIFRRDFMGKEKPFLLIDVRTWFLTELSEDGAEKMAAVVDANHNGRFNDPEDVLFIDTNNNGFFESGEGQKRGKNGIKLKTANRVVSVDWDVYPDTLRLKEGTR